LLLLALALATPAALAYEGCQQPVVRSPTPVPSSCPLRCTHADGFSFLFFLFGCCCCF
jgi:hypothetical protein